MNINNKNCLYTYHWCYHQIREYESHGGLWKGQTLHQLLQQETYRPKENSIKVIV